MWQQLKDYPKYAVHPDGHIKNLESGCVLAYVKMKKGYKRVTLMQSDGTKTNQFIHKLIMLAFVGECPIGYNIDHEDRDPSNNKLTNLKYIISGDNSAQSGDSLQGENAQAAILTTAQVKEIRRLHNYDISKMELSKKYRVARRTISDIINRNTWSHI